MEAQVARVVEAMGTSGKTLMFPGNIYNFAGADRVDRRPTLRSIRRRRAAHPGARRAAARGRGARAATSRPSSSAPATSTARTARGDWFDQAILREAGKGKVAQHGPSGRRPRLGLSAGSRQGLRAASRRCATTLGAFERFHFAGHFVTPEQMTAAVKAAAPVPLKVTSFPWLVLPLMGIANPVIREVLKMRYLWENPMALEDARLDALLGPDFGTPFEEAVAAATARFFPAMKQAA